MHEGIAFVWIIFGAFLAAIAIEVFLFPNRLIDGGIVGVALILARVYGETYFPYLLILLNLPFIYLAFFYIRRSFVIHMFIGVLAFAGFSMLLQNAPHFTGETLEIVVFGGAILGIGAGLIIRSGGCLDGTEILAIMVNRKKGITIGQFVLFINIFIFGAYGLVFSNWHIALRSMLMYVVAFKMIDFVILGFDELKSAIIICSKPKELGELITKELGLGLTILQGKGGFTGTYRDILFVIVERLDLSDLKELVLREDPEAFMAIENLHEVVYGKQPYFTKKQSLRKRLFKPHLIK